MELVSLLMKNDFSTKEANIYLACLQLKEANIGTIARFAKENRSTTYSIIKELKKKGVIHEITKNKVASYSAVQPQNILQKLEMQAKEFKELLPAFAAITEKFGMAPQIQFFEGLDGVIGMYDDVLLSQVDISAFLGTSEFPKAISDYIQNVFFPKKIQKNIYSRTLLSDNDTNKKNIKKIAAKKYKRERRIKKGLTFMENIIINLYGPNKVMIVVFTEKEPFGLIISSYHLYEMLLSIFDFLWPVRK